MTTNTNSVQKAKNDEQIAALSAWAKIGYKGTYEGTTGVGKTRVGCLAAGEHIKRDQKFRVLITTPTQNLRDIEWVNELNKWGYGKYLSTGNIIIECIQSAYLRSNEHWNLLILDEVHTTLSPQYRKLLMNNHFDKILGLTATIQDDEEKLLFLKQYAPICYRTPLSKALQLGIVSPFIVYNLPIELTSTERKEYDFHNKTFFETFPLFDYDLKELYKCVADKIYFEKKLSYNGKTYQKYKNYPYRCSKALRTRKSIIYNAQNKIDTVSEIANKLAVDRKIIIFSESIQFAERIQQEVDKCTIFHSDEKKLSNAQRLDNLAKFGQDFFTRISAVQALNAGLNVPSCDMAIVASGTSTSRDFFQRLGRILRIDDKNPNKLAVLIQLYVKDSQEIKWINARSENSPNVKWIQSLKDIQL